MIGHLTPWVSSLHSKSQLVFISFLVCHVTSSDYLVRKPLEIIDEFGDHRPCGIEDILQDHKSPCQIW